MVNTVNLIIFLASLRELLPFRRIIRLDGFCLDDHACVTPLIVLALVRNRPRHVTTRRRYHTRQNDCHA